MKRTTIIVIAVVLLLLTGLLIWRLSTRQTQPPGLVFPTAEATSEATHEPSAQESAVPDTSDVTSASETHVTDTAESSDSNVQDEHQAYTLLTSHDPLHQFALTFDGNTITVDGVYDGDEVKRISLESADSVKPQYVGERVTATLCTEDAAGPDEVDIWLASGTHIPVHIVYDENGFPQPLITDALARSALALAHPITVPSSAVDEYILTSGSKAERDAVLEHIRRVSEQVCRGLDSDYDKARALSVWVSENIYYDYVAYASEVNVETLSLAHTLELQRTVCGGYANLYAALCQAQGITCHVVKGTCIQGGGTFAGGGHAAPSHEWNVVELDGRHLWVDTLWNTDNAYDGEYIYGDQKLRYFDISDECMAVNHRAERIEIRRFFP